MCNSPTTSIDCLIRACRAFRNRSWIDASHRRATSSISICREPNAAVSA